MMPPSVPVVMGVSGSGKSTIAPLLAGRLHWNFEDADDRHPVANAATMHAGLPLTDEDRWPRLDAVAGWIDATRAAGRHGGPGLLDSQLRGTDRGESALVVSIERPPTEITDAVLAALGLVTQIPTVMSRSDR